MHVDHHHGDASMFGVGVGAHRREAAVAQASAARPPLAGDAAAARGLRASAPAASEALGSLKSWQN
jgi:hypothetical protein